MALILDTDLLCIERGGQSYKWTGAELKGQITGLSPIAQIDGVDPIVVSQTGRDATISIKDASISQRGAVVLSNTIDTSQDKAMTPMGVKDALDLKANLDGSNAVGTWNINITGSSPASENSTNAVNAENVYVERDDDSNANRYLTFVDDATAGNRGLSMDTSLKYNPATNTLTASTFTGNLNGTASSASSATNANNATNATNATNINILSDNNSTTRYINFSSLTSGNDRVRADGGLTYNPSSNSLSVGGNITAGGDINSNSDETLKTDIETIQGALESLKQVRGVSFTWKGTEKKSMGVIAQDVEKVFPDIVDLNVDKKSVVYNGLIGALVEAVKELSERVEELESKVSK
jgi:hypothetical protein